MARGYFFLNACKMSAALTRKILVFSNVINGRYIFLGRFIRFAVGKGFSCPTNQTTASDLRQAGGYKLRR